MKEQVRLAGEIVRIARSLISENVQRGDTFNSDGRTWEVVRPGVTESRAVCTTKSERGKERVFDNKVVKKNKLAHRIVAGHEREWDEIIDLLKTKKHFGNEQVVDFIAEVWNGGVLQWVENGKDDDMHAVVGVLRSIGPKGRDLASKLSALKGDIEEYKRESDRPRHGGGEADVDTLDELSEGMNELDDWFYKNDDAVIAELLAYMQQ